MQQSHSLGVALCLVFGLIAPAQDQKPTAESKPRKPLTAAQLEVQKLREDLLGAWRLVGATTGGEDFSGDECGGVMLVMEDYMSITARFQSSHPVMHSNTGELFSSGAYRWSYDADRLMLVSTTLLGMDNFSNTEVWGYQPGGERREYRIDLASDSLTLMREGNRRFEFTRMNQPSRRDDSGEKR